MIPQDVTALLDEWIESVWTLDVLLLLHRTPSKSWSTSGLIGELRASADVVSRSIPNLASAGLIKAASDGSVAYAPVRPELHETVVRLERLYRESPVTVVRHIALAQDSKLRRFADAFKFRKG